MVAMLVEPKENDRIYDPTCGSGGLLLKAYAQANTNKVAIYGQEKNMQTWALCSMNMFYMELMMQRFGRAIRCPILRI